MTKCPSVIYFLVRLETHCTVSVVLYNCCCLLTACHASRAPSSFSSRVRFCVNTSRLCCACNALNTQTSLCGKCQLTCNASDLWFVCFWYLTAASNCQYVFSTTLYHSLIDRKQFSSTQTRVKYRLWSRHGLPVGLDLRWCVFSPLNAL